MKNTYVCEQCGRAFSTVRGLAIHIGMTVKAPAIGKQRGRPRTKCTGCARVFRSAHGLRIHDALVNDGFIISHVIPVRQRSAPARRQANP